MDTDSCVIQIKSPCAYIKMQAKDNEGRHDGYKYEERRGYPRFSIRKNKNLFGQ